MFPPLADLVAMQFKGIHRNLAYIVSFANQTSALRPLPNGFLIDLQPGICLTWI